MIVTGFIFRTENKTYYLQTEEGNFVINSPHNVTKHDLNKQATANTQPTTLKTWTGEVISGTLQIVHVP